MELTDRTIVVTGAAHGIGRALALRMARERPAGIVVFDIDGEAVSEVAREIVAGGGAAIPVTGSVATEDDIRRAVDEAESGFGPVDVFCSNAGIGVGGGVEVPDHRWQRIWEINVLSHVYAARRVIPTMLERGEGYLLQTVSAAGLLTNLGAAPYSVTKHAAIGLAEWLAVTYGDRGVRVSCLCPMGVRTAGLLPGGGDGKQALGSKVVLASGAVLDPEDVAEFTVAAMADEPFLILPHPEVGEYFKNKATDYGRWIGGMRKLSRRLQAHDEERVDGPR